VVVVERHDDLAGLKEFEIVDVGRVDEHVATLVDGLEVGPDVDAVEPCINHCLSL
jgi:hypothetical protein